MVTFKDQWNARNPDHILVKKYTLKTNPLHSIETNTT